MALGTLDLLVPCENPDCDHMTAVRRYGSTLYEPSYESTDTCESCGWTLDMGSDEVEYDDGYDDPRL